MSQHWVGLLLVAACATPDPAPGDTDPTGTAAGTPTGTTPTTGTLSTGSTTTTPFTFDCTQPLVVGPAPFTPLEGYSEAEDFDFHPDGWAGIVNQGNLVAKDRYGGTLVIASGVANSAAGTRVLSTGDWVVADAGSGQVYRVEHATGAVDSLIAGMNWPNGIEVGSNDDLFITDFGAGRIVQSNAWNPLPVVEIDSGLDQPNGIALSPDEQTLYVVLSWTAAVLAYDRNGTDWDGPRIVHYQPGGNYQGLTVDYCGNLYITDVRPYGDSDILRISADESTVDVATTLPSGYVPNVHFGHDVAGWDRFMLYASDREDGRLFEIDLAIPGKTHPALTGSTP